MTTTTPTDRPHLLIADDDADIRDLVTAQLMREGYRLTPAGDVAGIRAVLAAGIVDLIVLDLGLPDGDGLTLCRELRAEGYEGAIIMVTARDSAIDRVLGLELGADDYLTKPFEPRELTARVRNLLRRGARDAGAVGGPRNALFGRWRLDLTKRRLLAPGDSVVMLSTAEFDMLSRLVQSAGRPLSREALFPARAATAAYDRTIDNQISRLRQKLRPDGDDLILTVRGQGYMLAATVRFE
ncbi:response regulator transcription factor [Sphingomonas arantia]|uniref:Response regulator transcription factor n=1 Tax=Sphingomonas arantia TaxID=1460676 RepID=A0ABW4U2P5_9SPHN